jgi:hypothetical protein
MMGKIPMTVIDLLRQLTGTELTKVELAIKSLIADRPTARLTVSEVERRAGRIKRQRISTGRRPVR